MELRAPVRLLRCRSDKLSCGIGGDATTAGAKLARATACAGNFFDRRPTETKTRGILCRALYLSDAAIKAELAVQPLVIIRAMEILFS